MARVLISDDNSANRAFLVDLLGHYGHSILEARDGAEALSTARLQHPDLVISDILMPAMDGYEFVRRLRSDPSIADIPVILQTSAYSEEEARPLAEACGASHFLMRPVVPSSLLDAVSVALRGSPYPACPAPVPEAFEEMHKRLLTDKLSEKERTLAVANGRLAALIELGLQLGRQTRREAILEHACTAACDILQAERAELGILNEAAENFCFFFACSPGGCQPVADTQAPSPREGFLAQILADARPHRADCARCPLTSVCKHGEKGSEPMLPARLGVPIASAGHTYGALCLIGKRGTEGFSEQDEQLARTIATQVAVSYESATRHGALQCQAAELQAEREKHAQSQRRLERIVRASNDGILTIDSAARVDFVNRQLAEMLGYSIDELLGRPLFDLMDEQARAEAEACLQERRSGVAGQFEFRFRHKNGADVWTSVSASPILADDGSFQGCLAMIRDNTARRQAEDERARLANQNRLLLESTGEAVTGVDHDHRCFFANRAAEELLGYGPGELIGKDMHALVHYSHADGSPYPLEECSIGVAALQGKGARMASEVFWRSDGTCFPVEWASFPILENGDVKGAVVTFSDITERKRTEFERDTALRKLQDVMDAVPDMVYSIGPNGTIMSCNRKAREVIGLSEQEIQGRSITQFLPDDERAPALEFLRSVQEGKARVFEGHLLRQDGSTIPYEWTAALLRDGRGSVIGVTGTGRDVTRQKLVEAEIRSLNRRLEEKVRRLDALRAVDTAITTRLPVAATLRLVLDTATEVLGGHAASLMLFDPTKQRLIHSASVGFRAESLPAMQLALEECAACRTELGYRTLSIPNLSLSDEKFVRAPLFEREGFIAYHAAPLVIDGHVRGLLEVFHRSIYEPNRAWIEFLECLASQAAIAVETTSLIDNLNASNAELTQAYDATIQGWACALELRDHETEGHSRRVAEQTVELARALGVGEADLVQIRRGALLHDVGKIAVPDEILLKPGPLTAEEWVAMRRHPTLAYEMLAPIAFLRPALDIPYCHHERWDGTGYPRGLAGEEIPLAARIFAVVDIWDALSHERPYRSAWPPEKVREHLRELAGNHLDPSIVAKFLELIAEPGQATGAPIR